MTESILCVSKGMLPLFFRASTSEFCEQRPIMVSPTSNSTYISGVFFRRRNTSQVTTSRTERQVYLYHIG